MAAATYIQEAANLVRNAVAALQQDIHTIQTETYNAQSHLGSQADGHDNEATALRVQIVAEHNTQEKMSMEARVRQLAQATKQKRDEVIRRGEEAARVVQAKNSLINNLQGVASQLDHLASSAG